ncbi:Tat pathway signal sequence domain protein [Streptomyces sp. NBC_01620]|uniref:phage baseplate protein n=1 Tax=unclassified Streptomyces TaxID=2593676 RepID=UPI0036815D3E|nr:Tat pathway signal sequence domain protein [Streptomyces sp. NBC_01620]
MGSETSGSSTVNRRQLLKWAVGALGVAGIGTAAVVATGGTADAAVASSKRFDLTDPSDMLFREILLQETRVLQSFSFDNTNKHLYTASLVQGGRQLPGESRAYTGDERAKYGDLCITRLDLTGAEIGRMYLKGFGHGVSIAVEPSGNSAYLWTETSSVEAPDPNYPNDPSKNIGWGSKIGRFKFANGSVLTADSSKVTTFSPVAGADRTTIAIDPVNKRLAVRYRLSGAFQFGLYDLTAFTAGTYTQLAHVMQPTDIANPPSFQGFTTFGQYLYLLEGEAYSASNPDPGNTYQSVIDWNTGTRADRRLSAAGSSLAYREPEGLAIQIPDTAKPTEARLVTGFASTTSATDSNKKASFYYKDALI